MPMAKGIDSNVAILLFFSVGSRRDPLHFN